MLPSSIVSLNDFDIVKKWENLPLGIGLSNPHDYRKIYNQFNEINGKNVSTNYSFIIFETLSAKLKYTSPVF